MLSNNEESSYLYTNSALIGFLGLVKGIQIGITKQESLQVNAYLTPLVAIISLLKSKSAVPTGLITQAFSSIDRIMALLEKQKLSEQEAYHVQLFADKLRVELQDNCKELLINLKSNDNWQRLNDLLALQNTTESSASLNTGGTYKNSKGLFIFEDRDDINGIQAYSQEQSNIESQKIMTKYLDHVRDQLMKIKSTDPYAKDFDSKALYEKVDDILKNMHDFSKGRRFALSMASSYLKIADSFFKMGSGIYNAIEINENELALAFIHIYTATRLMNLIKEVCPPALLPVSDDMGSEVMKEGERERIFTTNEVSYHFFLLALLIRERDMHEPKYLTHGLNAANKIIDTLVKYYDPDQVNDLEAVELVTMLYNFAMLLIAKEKLDPAQVSAGTYKPAAIELLEKLINNINFLFKNPNVEEVISIKRNMAAFRCEFASMLLESKIENSDVLAIQFLKEALHILSLMDSEEDSIKDICFQLSTLYLTMGMNKWQLSNQPQKAIPYLASALKYAETLNNPGLTLKIATQLLDAYYKSAQSSLTKHPEAAKLLFDRALSIIKTAGLENLLEKYQYEDKNKLLAVITAIKGSDHTSNIEKKHTKS